MPRHDERERIRRRLGVLTERVGASRAAAIPPGRPAVVAHTGHRSPASTPHRSGRPGRSRAAAPARWDRDDLPDNDLERDAEVPVAGAFGEDEARPGPIDTALRRSDTGDARSGDGWIGDGRSGDGRVGDGRTGVGWIGDGRSGDGRGSVAEAGSALDTGPPDLDRHVAPARPEVRTSTARASSAARRDAAWGAAQAPADIAADEFAEVDEPEWLREPQAPEPWTRRLVPERFRGARVDPGRRGAVTLVLVGVLAVLVTAFVLTRAQPVTHPVPPLASVRTTTAPPGVPVSGAARTQAAAPGSVPVPETPPATGELVVSVVGLVHRGGLVRLPAGARVADAIAAAGGPRDGADLTGLNLAQRVQDGDQILVGAAAPTGDGPRLGSATISAGGAGGAAGTTTGAPVPGTAGKIDLNTATEAQLDALPGVGPVTARAILAWRTANGRFTAVDQLAEVDGIGPARLARLRELVTV
ncbi:helix-hairpin-helix domain-containing protein [Nocardia farcinica]|uniref:helix-hairpin-helix domain-containing protein n=1 Tax=Nocardia farcinica TaxID=37329 RepID=UPI0018939C95|nr:helix-hairpin-helix domain-containing protein [Nocardia farcinica]MBF6140527.1 helix-hairpin-helix domain-containing protein [Nocardia farcinica]MBF6257667.1 helix-hairpin-helix domain-containing protein [Nocardia farcinica]MBF6372681.1 helix-hairpin-helix domain-containing protein [Nocardia farcinica]MBF6442188.1 helix-hairpin-helix domain-containing protein [Nocardia farcinica]